LSGIVPAQIKAGITFSNLVTLTAYPAPDWALSVALRGPASIDLLATADGSQHKLVAAAAATAGYAPGLYAYSARVERDGEVVEVESGTVTVLADLAQSTGGDMRSHNRKVLDSILAVIEKRATLDQERYRINNRELYRTPIADLLKLKAHYQALVAAEDAKARGQSVFGRVIRMRLQ
jgi:hypothetical protein